MFEVVRKYILSGKYNLIFIRLLIVGLISVLIEQRINFVL
jgi:hypothetical protein